MNKEVVIGCCIAVVIGILLVLNFPFIEERTKQVFGIETRVPEDVRSQSDDVRYAYAVDLGYKVYLDGVWVSPSTINVEFYNIAFDDDARRVFLTKKVS